MAVVQIVLIFSNKHLNKEFYKIIRWTQKEVVMTKNGLNILTLELNFFKRFFFRLFLKSWVITKFFNHLGIEFILGKIEALRYAHSAAYCGIIFPNDTEKDWINAGRVLERLWLTGTREGLSIQPVSATLLLKKICSEEPAFFTKSQTLLLTKSAHQIEKIFTIGKSERLMFIFRIGTSTSVAHRSLRKKPEIHFES